MNKNYLFALLIGLAVLMSCDKSLMNKKQNTKTTLNLKGLMDSLTNAAVHHNPLLLKNIRLNGLLDTARMHHDSAGWHKELQLFRELNVRQSRLTGRYQKSIRTVDDTLEQVVFRANDYDGSDLDSIYILQDKVHSNPVQLSFYLHDQNKLFASTKRLHLYLRSDRDTLKVASYSITGHQRMKLGDSTSFEIDATLKY